MYTGVEAMVPAAPTVMLVPTLEAKVELVDASKPVGVATVIPACILTPETLKVVVEEAVPYVVVSAERDPVVEITGNNVPVICISSITHASLVLLLSITIFILACVQLSGRSTEMVEYPSVVRAPPPEGEKDVAVLFPE